MNIRQLKFKPIMAEPAVPELAKVECDGPELFTVLAKINANGQKVTSMSVRRPGRYVLNVQKAH